VRELWSPSTEKIEASQIYDFCRTAEITYGLELPDYQALHSWSTEAPASFWEHVWEKFDVLGNRGELVVEHHKNLQESIFFPQASLNVSENLLRRNDRSTAMVWQDELGSRSELSWEELHRLVSQLQQALRGIGIETGDHVAAWMPNRPETYALMLATASLGAVFTSTSPDFGSQGVLDRFNQVRPKLLVATEGYFYGGKWFSCLERLDEIEAGLPSLVETVLLPYGSESDNLPQNVRTLWSDFIDTYEPSKVEYARVGFNHPWYVLFSSGTTGKPKCIVHRTGGVLLKHLVEHKLHCDITPGDRVFYYTSAGWMMWNWLASTLGSEATLILYDGSPFYPNASRLFELVEEAEINLFGVSAKFIDACSKENLSPAGIYDLGSLKTICSTGSPLSPEGFDYIYKDVKEDVHLQSISGGTDLCGCLVAGDPTSPVHRGEIQKPALAMAIEVLDEAGNLLGPGQQGELACSSPFPSMPLYFLDDPDGTKYKSAYFERYPGKWHQGDFAEWTDNGGIIIHGRSDATLNPGGVRIGTAEIYRIVDSFPEIKESLVIGQTWEKDTRIILFVILVDQVELDDQLRIKIKDALRYGASPRHVPAIIIETPDLPRTRSGKLSELAVRSVVEGKPVKNTEALANPEALEYFYGREELSID
jgi:acetoacetyl-CoA synthetase